jgi:hypothetical protein
MHRSAGFLGARGAVGQPPSRRISGGGAATRVQKSSPNSGSCETLPTGTASAAPYLLREVRYGQAAWASSAKARCRHTVQREKGIP